MAQIRCSDLCAIAVPTNFAIARCSMDTSLWYARRWGRPTHDVNFHSVKAGIYTMRLIRAELRRHANGRPLLIAHVPVSESERFTTLHAVAAVGETSTMRDRSDR